MRTEIQTSILAFRKRRYLWAALALTFASLVAYWIHDPQEPPNGGTTLGYALGTLGAMMIVWLTWFGVRKRRYSSTAGTLQGWLSAHVYFGIALPVVVLLHAGFQLGWNIHTLAFVLMTLVIASGLYGVFIYMKNPERMSENRGGVSRSELLDELEDIDRRSRRVAEKLSADYQEFVTSGIQRTELGSTLWQRLRNEDRSRIQLPQKSGTVANQGQEAAMDWLAEQQSRADAATATTIAELSALLRNKRKLLRQVGEDLRLQAGIEIWLYAHVPLTAALLVALIAHIVTVFLYW
ncbi:MAG: hypothetical protein IIA12_06055 [Proteobacteria bacterium]|nr:hypothetical protein [Pseudomonadota bacterium]